MARPVFARHDVMAALDGANGLDDLYGVFDELLHAGRHKKRRSLWPAPATEFKPMHWRYREARTGLDRAGEWISTELAERRKLLMFNPVGDNHYASVRTRVRVRTAIRQTHCGSCWTPDRDFTQWWTASDCR